MPLINLPESGDHNNNAMFNLPERSLPVLSESVIGDDIDVSKVMLEGLSETEIDENTELATDFNTARQPDSVRFELPHVTATEDRPKNHQVELSGFDEMIDQVLNNTEIQIEK